MAKSEKIDFEAAMLDLENILEKMSSEDVTLDESIELYAKAAERIQQCNEKIKDAKRRVEEIGVSLEEIEVGDEL